MIWGGVNQEEKKKVRPYFEWLETKKLIHYWLIIFQLKMNIMYLISKASFPSSLEQILSSIIRRLTTMFGAICHADK